MNPNTITVVTVDNLIIHEWNSGMQQNVNTLSRTPYNPCFVRNDSTSTCVNFGEFFVRGFVQDSEKVFDKKKGV